MVGFANLPTNSGADLNSDACDNEMKKMMKTRRRDRRSSGFAMPSELSENELG